MRRGCWFAAFAAFAALLVVSVALTPACGSRRVSAFEVLHKVPNSKTCRCQRLLLIVFGVWGLGAFDFRLSALLLFFLIFFCFVCVFIFAALPGYDFCIKVHAAHHTAV